MDSPSAPSLTLNERLARELAGLHILMFDLGEAILPSRPQKNCSAVSSGGQGWPPPGGHPKGSSLTAASTAASSGVAGRKTMGVVRRFLLAVPPYSSREAELVSPSKPVFSTSVES